MSFLDKAIASVAPTWGVNRARSRKVLAAYEQGQPSRLRKNKKETRDANAPVRESAVRLRSAARELEQNNAIVSHALDILCARVVGMGIFPEPQVLDDSGEPLVDLNREIKKLHKQWRRKPEVTWQWDEGSAQRLMLRTLTRDGEVFANNHIGLTRRLQHGSNIPFSYEMLEPDFVPFEFQNNRTRETAQGITVNAWKRPTFYHVHKEHPGGSFSTTATLQELKRVPADRMTHLKLANRIHQVRGVSAFSNVIDLLTDIREIDDAEILAAKIASFMAVAIRKGEPVVYTPPVTDENGNVAPRELDLHAGMVFDDLQPGEDITVVDSKRPNNELIPFREMLLRSGVAGGVGVSGSSLTKNYNGTYSSQRQELVEQRDIYGIIWSYIVERSERDKYDRFMQAAIPSLDVPDSVDEDTLSNCLFSRPALPWIDPDKEAKGWTTVLDAGLDSKQNIIRSRGLDPHDILTEREMDAILDPQEEEEEAVEEAVQVAPPTGPVEAMLDGMYQHPESGAIYVVEDGIYKSKYPDIEAAVRAQAEEA